MAHVFEVTQCSADLVEGLLLLVGLRLDFIPVFICTHLPGQALAMHLMCALMLHLWRKHFPSFARHP